MAALALALTACGNRLSHQAIVDAAGGNGQSSAGGAANTSGLGPGDTSALGPSSSSGPAVDTTAGPSAPSSGSGASSAGPGAAGAATGPSVSRGSSSGSSVSAGAGSAQSGGSPAGGATAAASSPAGGFGTILDGGCKPASLSPVNVGWVGTRSGVIGAILGSAAPGVQIWAKAANQCGGLGGHQVNVFVADDQGDPSVALSETQQMVNSDHVIAFLNDQLVLSMSATLTNYLQQVGVPVIGGDDTSSPWFNSAMLFPQASSVATVAATEVKYAVDHGLEKMAIYSCVEAVPCQTYENDVLADIQSHPGATAAASAKVSLTAPSFISECEQAKSAGAQVLLLGLETTSLERFADDCAQQASYHPQYIGYSLGVQSSVSSDPNLNGLYLATTDFPWSDASVPITQAYQRALTQFAPGFNNGGPASTSWAAGIVAQEAARHLPADKPSAKDMLSGLLTIRNDSFGGATPPLTYTSALPRNPGNCTFEIALQGGKFVTPNGDQQRCA